MLEKHLLRGLPDRCLVVGGCNVRLAMADDKSGRVLLRITGLIVFVYVAFKFSVVYSFATKESTWTFVVIAAMIV